MCYKNGRIKLTYAQCFVSMRKLRFIGDSQQFALTCDLVQQPLVDGPDEDEETGSEELAEHCDAHGGRIRSVSLSETLLHTLSR